MNRGWLRWGWLMLIVPAVIGLARLRFDVEVLNLLPDELPTVHGLKLYQQHFQSGRELIITLRAPDGEAAEAAARQLAANLRAQTNLVARADWQAPLQEHPEQMGEVIAYLWLNQPPDEFARLTNRLAPGKLDDLLRTTREQLATTLSPTEIARLSHDPFGLTRLPATAANGERRLVPEHDPCASADGTFRALFVEAGSDLDTYRDAATWLCEVKAVVDRGTKSPEWPAGVTIRFTGAPAFVTEVAGGMERDIRNSVLGSLLLITGLFWWAHRSWRPLLCLLGILVLIVAGALGFGGLLFGKLNAVSLGFTAILAGLAVDYGLVLYQEWKASPHLGTSQLRQLHAPGIVWSAVTTASAFALLSFVGLPGLTQLGSLVAMGVLLAAVLMLYAFLPLFLRVCPGASNPKISRPSQSAALPGGSHSALALGVTAIVVALSFLILSRNCPPMDHSTHPLQPRSSPAQTALEEMQSELNRQDEPLLFVVAGRDEAEVAHRLDAASAHFSRAVTNNAVRSFLLPTALWPHPDWQRTNLAAGIALAAQADAMNAAARDAGFTTNALALLENVLRTWTSAAKQDGVIWPANQAGEWMLRRAAARDNDGWLAAGLVYPETNIVTATIVAELTPKLPGVWLTAWPLLGDVLLQHVERRLLWVMFAMIIFVTLSLWLAFRRWTEVVLSFATVGFSLLVLLAIMGLAGGSWNLMNLMAVPILLGAGVDYTIHVQLALRRHSGDIAAVRRITGRAVFLCAATTVAGFGSNAFASNAGLASLGLVCATGIATVYVAAIFLLPAWWRATVGRSSGREHRGAVSSPKASATPNPAARLSSPSTSYRADVWRLGLLVARILPEGASRWTSSLAASVYRWLRPERFRVVVENLLPVLGDNQPAAERAARALFREFALKITHLWRFESGQPIDSWRTEWAGREFLAAARARGRGVLLITPHLGNWEFGGALLTRSGEKLLVLTQPEPGRGFTELRQKSRARWGIETLVVGEDAFAFVEIIKQLQAGATVALLVDRPPSPTAVTVQLFGRPFPASIAAAELARASGCAVLPTFVVRTPQGYRAEILPEVVYERAAIGDRAARIRLTQEILRAFEPVIRQHVEQWYHFVPVWTLAEKHQAPTSKLQ